MALTGLLGACDNPPPPADVERLEVAVGPRIQVYLNDALYIDHHDETFAAGHVGLWTKADAVTEFDDLVVRGMPAGGG